MIRYQITRIRPKPESGWRGYWHAAWGSVLVTIGGRVLADLLAHAYGEGFVAGCTLARSAQDSAAFVQDTSGRTH